MSEPPPGTGCNDHQDSTPPDDGSPGELGGLIGSLPVGELFGGVVGGIAGSLGAALPGVLGVMGEEGGGVTAGGDVGVGAG